MSEQERIRRRGGHGDEQEVIETVVHERTSGLDDLLDEIDQVLESDASDYVRSFVQKGGQ